MDLRAADAADLRQLGSGVTTDPRLRPAERALLLLLADGVWRFATDLRVRPIHAKQNATQRALRRGWIVRRCYYPPARYDYRITEAGRVALGETPMPDPQRCACCGVIVTLVDGLCGTCRDYGCKPGDPALECEGRDWPFTEAEYGVLMDMKRAHVSE